MIDMIWRMSKRRHFMFNDNVCFVLFLCGKCCNESKIPIPVRPVQDWEEKKSLSAAEPMIRTAPTSPCQPMSSCRRN